MQHENILSIFGLQFAENIIIKTMTAAAAAATTTTTTTTATTTAITTTAITTTVGTLMRTRMGPMK